VTVFPSHDPSRFTVDGAAAASVGTNISSGVRWQVADYWRIITRVGYTGSASAGDAIVQLFVGPDTYYGDYENTVTGLVITDEDAQMKRTNILVPPLVPINAIVSDAGATNATRLHVDIEPYSG